MSASSSFVTYSELFSTPNSESGEEKHKIVDTAVSSTRHAQVKMRILVANS